MSSMNTERAEPYTLRLPADFWPLVDAWRRTQPDLPTRAEAVRRLVAAGLGATQKEPNQ